ncbi:MAG: hypothetical protein ABRQ37_19640 [Candidatus Eremiobacterota bacterium]
MVNTSEELSMALFNKEREIIIKNHYLIRKIRILFYIYELEGWLKRDKRNILFPLLYIPVFLAGYILSRFYDPFYITYKLYKNYRYQKKENLSMAFILEV